MHQHLKSQMEQKYEIRVDMYKANLKSMKLDKLIVFNDEIFLPLLVMKMLL